MTTLNITADPPTTGPFDREALKQRATQLLALLIVLLDALILILPILFANKCLPWLTGKGYKLWKAK